MNLSNIKQERISPFQSEGTGETSSTASPDSSTSSDEDDNDDFPTSPSAISEKPSWYSVEYNLDFLTKLFPQLDKQILVMILKACENNLIKAIQLLVPYGNMAPCTLISPHIPNVQHLPPRVPIQRQPVFQPIPHRPTFTNPPRMLQASGLNFPAHPGYVTPQCTNLVGFHPRALESAYTSPRRKSPWYFTVPGQPLNKRPMLSKNFVSPSEMTKTVFKLKCSDCGNFLNISDRFCSQCGKNTLENDD